MSEHTAEFEITCPRCNRPAVSLTMAGFAACSNAHVWRLESFRVQDEACEAALDGYLPGFSWGEVWAFREGWKAAINHHLSGAPDIAIPAGYTRRKADEIIKENDLYWNGSEFVEVPKVREFVGEVGERKTPIIYRTG